MKNLFALLIFASLAVLTACAEEPATPQNDEAISADQAVSLRAVHRVDIRLTNPTQIDGTTKYDVEFKASAPGLRLTGMNVRLWVPALQFGWIGMSDFAPGYEPLNPNPALVNTGNASSGMLFFGFTGPARYINGAMHLATPSHVYLDNWTKLFSINLSGVPACPIVILDKESNPAFGGFLPGSDGITILCDIGSGKSFNVDEYVQHINWNQTSFTMPFGAPVPCNN